MIVEGGNCLGSLQWASWDVYCGITPVSSAGARDSKDRTCFHTSRGTAHPPYP